MKPIDEGSSWKQRFSLRRLVEALREKPELAVEELLVVGIDFGTTYTGASWATIADFESGQINTITTWPGHGPEEGKVPTVLYHDTETDSVRWGYDVPEDVTPLRWFKLLLLHEKDLPDDVRQADMVLAARRTLRDSRKSAVDAVADYLRVFWKHVVETIERERGRSVVDAMRLHIVVTVPAIWKGYARKDMEQAFRKAGILAERDSGPTTLSFASEPEAAAMATMYDRGDDIAKGDVYVVCDAGGGTVDLVTYEIANPQPVELREVSIGTGGLCGGIFIDEAFQTMCRTRLGRVWYQLSPKGVQEIMKREWEEGIKPQFMPHDRSKKYIVSIPAEVTGKGGLEDDNRRPIIKNGRIHFSSKDINGTFTAVFADIKTLVADQVQAAKRARLAPTGVILVGGLGTNRYLHDYLERSLRAEGIDVLQASGMRPRTAISRGAVFKGFSRGLSTKPDDAASPLEVKSLATVVSTVARQSLGIVTRVPFDKRQHAQEDKVWDKLDGRWWADNQMKWLILKGNRVLNTEPVSYAAFKYCDSSKEDEKLYVRCCQSEANVPPRRFSEAVTTLASIYCHVDGQVAWESLEDYTTTDGRRIKRAVLDIRIIPSGATAEFSVYCQGKLLSSKNVDIQYE